MEALLREVLNSVWAIEAVKARRRHALRRGLECDVLENRQLLAFASGGLASYAALGHLRSGLAAYGHHALFQRGGHSFLRNSSSAGSATSNLSITPSQTSANSTNLAPATPNSQMPGAPSSQASTIPNSGPSPQLKADFQKLQTDFHAIVAKSQVTTAETVALRDDLKAIDKAATSAPSQTAVQSLQNDVSSLQGALPTDAQKTQLVADFTSVVNSRGVTDQTLIDKTVGDAQAILASSNVTSDDLATIAADRKAIQTDMGSQNPTATLGGPTGGGDNLMSLGGLLGGQMGGMRGPMGHGGRFGGAWGGGPSGSAPGGFMPGPRGGIGGPFGGRMV